MSAATISPRTIGLFSAGLIAIIAMAIFIGTGVGGKDVSIAVADIGELSIVLASAVYVLWVALSFGAGEAIRKQWLAIGLGMLSFGIGDAVWTYLEVFRGVEPPYPGLPDAFYLVEYPLVAFGVITAGLAYRGLVPLKKPAVVATGAVVVLLAALWAGLLQPHIVFADIPAGEKVLSALYPVADLVLYLGPALFVAFIVSSLGGGKLARPWWAVVAGIVCLAFADVGYSWLSAYDAYQSGSFIDYGWSAGHLFIAVGASVLYDLANPAPAQKRASAPLEAA